MAYDFDDIVLNGFNDYYDYDYDDNRHYISGPRLIKCAPIKQGWMIGYDYYDDLDDDSDNHHHYYDNDDDDYKVHYNSV